MRWSTAVRAALAVAVVAACDEGQGGEAGSTPPPRVEAVVAWSDTVHVTVPAVGSLEADQRVHLAAEASGRVSEILVQEGERVEHGQLLIRLGGDKLEAEARAAEAALAGARQEVENLEAQHRRNRDLLAQGAISEQAFDDLETALESARARADASAAQLALARERLADAAVRAPFGGTVGERDVDLGQYVAAGDPLLLLVDADPLEIEFGVPERYLGELRIGSPVAVRVANQLGREFAGEVTFIAPVVEPTTRTVKVKASVGNPEGTLKPGQFAEVVLDLEARPAAVLVPETAVVPSGGDRFVYVVRGGRVERRTARLGDREPGRVEVLAGVAVGDTVIVAGQGQVGPDARVAVRMVPGETAPTESAPAESLSGDLPAAPEPAGPEPAGPEPALAAPATAETGSTVGDEGG